jgi:hypothetical protein
MVSTADLTENAVVIRTKPERSKAFIEALAKEQFDFSPLRRLTCKPVK